MSSVAEIWGIPAIVLFIQVILSGCLALLYLASLHKSARNALFFAIPGRLWRKPFTGLLRKSIIMDADKSGVEHLDGRVNLELFAEQEIDGIPVVRGDLWVRGGKRLSDIAISLALILFTLPLLLTVALLIKLTSRGPIFYSQTRVGRHGRHFRILKFRSMTVDAERDGAKWAGTNDARVTWIGRIIRKTRIDEIPQAINILKGDMSFVGPRPERPEFTAILDEQIPHYEERHRVKPGLTGWAQINYEYGASVEDARMKLRYDLYYIKNHSLILDLFIVVRTVSVAILGTGSR